MLQGRIMLVETVAIGATAGVQKGRGGLTWGPDLALLEKHNGSFRTWPSVVRFNVILAFVHRLLHPWLCGNVDPTRQGSRRLFSEENMHLFSVWSRHLSALKHQMGSHLRLWLVGLVMFFPRFTENTTTSSSSTMGKCLKPCAKSALLFWQMRVHQDAYIIHDR